MKEIISISKEILSLNKLNSMHWSKRSNHSKGWEEAIYYALGGKVKKSKKKMRVKVSSYRKRLLDTDNLIGGFKGGRDALKRLGLIVDDSPKWCDFEYEQSVGKSYPITIIELTTM